MWNNQGGDVGYGDTGGGYMTSPGNFGTPGQSSQERKSRNRAQNIMPCTVSQILQAQQTDDRFVIDNIDLHQVSLVGLVRSVKESATRLDYEIDDMSGPSLDVRQFVDNDENTPDAERTIPMRENTYVRVYGHVRAFGGKRSVVAFRMYQLVDMNELTTHLLEVIHSHLALTKGQQGGNNESMTTGGYGGGDMSTSYSGAQGDSMHGLTPIQRQVVLVIKACPDEQGLSISSVCERLRGMPQNSIKEAVEFLSAEGHIYSTIDDEHFRSTESMD